MALLIVTIFYGFYAFGLWFTICELGQRLTDAFEKIEDVTERFDWHLFSLEIRKMLPMILMLVQQPVELCFFGSAAGLRETFKEVILMNKFYSSSDLGDHSIFSESVHHFRVFYTFF